MTRFLITSDANGHEGHDPYCYLIETNIPTPPQLFFPVLKRLEFGQIGVMRRGGSWKEIAEELQKIGYDLKMLSHGRLSDYKDSGLEEYKLISGNY